MPGPQHSGRWSFWRGGGPDMSGPYAEASVGADSISARITAAVASPSYTPPAAPANCTPHQCGTARPEACSGHSAGVPAGLCGQQGRLKFQQTARGALHRTACPYSRSAGRTGSGRPADGLRPHRELGRCRFAAANRPAPGGSRARRPASPPAGGGTDCRPRYHTAYSIHHPDNKWQRYSVKIVC